MIETRLKDLREDNDFTQKQIARYLHISQSNYCNYENEKVNIPIEILDKLADLYKTSVDYIIKRTDRYQ